MAGTVAPPRFSIDDDLGRGDVLILLADVVKDPRCPRPRGKPLSRVRPFAWRLHGINGVRLEAIKTASGWATTSSAISRFHAALTRAERDKEGV